MLGIYPNSSGLVVGGLIVTQLSTGTLNLFKEDLTLTRNTTKADLVAAVADYSGYAAKAITAPEDAYTDRGGGASVIIPTQDFNFDGADVTPTENDIYGWWLEDTDAKLFACGKFDTPIPMQGVGDSIPLMILLNFCRNEIIQPVVGTDPA